MRTILILAALLASAAPTATADGCNGAAGTAELCTAEHSSSDGTACADGGFESGTTAVNANTAAANGAVVGSWFCSGAQAENTFSAGVDGNGVYWSEVSYDDPENGPFSTCFMFVLGTFHQCPGGTPPPNPGWGDALP